MTNGAAPSGAPITRNIYFVQALSLRGKKKKHNKRRTVESLSSVIFDEFIHPVV